MVLKRTPVFSDHFNLAPVILKGSDYKISSFDPDGVARFDTSLYTAILIGYQRYHIDEMARESAAIRSMNKAEKDRKLSVNFEYQRDSMRWVHVQKSVLALEKVHEYLERHYPKQANDRFLTILEDIGVYQAPKGSHRMSPIEVVSTMQTFDEHTLKALEDSDGLIGKLVQWGDSHDVGVSETASEYLKDIKTVKENIHSGLKREINALMDRLEINNKSEMLAMETGGKLLSDDLAFKISPTLEEHIAVFTVNARQPREISKEDADALDAYPYLNAYCSGPDVRKDSFISRLVERAKEKGEIFLTSAKGVVDVGKFFLNAAIVVTLAAKGSKFNTLGSLVSGFNLAKNIAGGKSTIEDLKDTVNIFKSNDKAMLKRLDHYHDKQRDLDTVAQKFFRRHEDLAMQRGDVEMAKNFAEIRQNADLASEMHKDFNKTALDDVHAAIDKAKYLSSGGDVGRRIIGSIDAHYGQKVQGSLLKATLIGFIALNAPEALSVITATKDLFVSGDVLSTLWNFSQNISSGVAKEFTESVALTENQSAGFLKTTADILRTGAAVAISWMASSWLKPEISMASAVNQLTNYDNISGYAFQRDIEERNRKLFSLINVQFQNYKEETGKVPSAHEILMDDREFFKSVIHEDARSVLGERRFENFIHAWQDQTSPDSAQAMVDHLSTLMRIQGEQDMAQYIADSIHEHRRFKPFTMTVQDIQDRGVRFNLLEFYEQCVGMNDRQMKRLLGDDGYKIVHTLFDRKQKVIDTAISEGPMDREIRVEITAKDVLPFVKAYLHTHAHNYADMVRDDSIKESNEARLTEFTESKTNNAAHGLDLLFPHFSGEQKKTWHDVADEIADSLESKKCDPKSGYLKMG